jgi:hypothetical protein
MKNNPIINRVQQPVAPRSDADIRAFVTEIMDRLRRFNGPKLVKVWLSEGPLDAARH